MKKLQKLTKEINELTLKIEQYYPELYQYLDENPITIPSQDINEPRAQSYSEYLGSLKSLLEHHIETHQKSDNV